MRNYLKENQITTPKPMRVLKLTLAVIVFAAVLTAIITAASCLGWLVTNTVIANRPAPTASQTVCTGTDFGTDFSGRVYPIRSFDIVNERVE